MQSPPTQKFPPLLYGIRETGPLTPEQLDQLLANGWARGGGYARMAHRRLIDGLWRPCLMLRIPLENFIWKKRMAKLLRRNGRLFTVRIRPFENLEQKEDFWRDYNWYSVSPLEHHLFGTAPSEDFNMWEACVYEGEKLIAFSIFERGKNSLTSLEAVYDPAYRKYSLGIYTMLLEIEFGINQGHAYYYPGFLPKGVSMFEYKLRPGGTEFFRLEEEKWIPWTELRPDDWPAPFPRWLRE